MKDLPINLKIFLCSIYTLTIASLFLFINNKYVPLKLANYYDIVFFIILIALTETFTVPFKNMSLSTSFAIQLSAFILFGPLTTIIVIVIGFSLRVLKVDGKYKHILNTPFYGTMFNNCLLILLLLYGNFAYEFVGGGFPVTNINGNIFPIIVFSIVFFLLNVFIISILSSIMSNKNIFYCFLSNTRLFFINISVMVPFGMIIIVIFNKYKYLGVVLLLFPIVLARYTFLLYIQAKSKYVETVDVLMHAMEARDMYTQGHTKRVGELATAIAKELKYNQWKIDNLYMAALLHDVGKIGIDDSILNKPGKLTEEEFNKIKTHPEIGYNILKDIKDMDKINFIVRHHHERYDGKGYPDGKKPEELNLDVFIIQLADSIDAMATDRPYRKALTKEEILQEVMNNRGTQFHPVVVDAYFKINKKQKKYS